MGSFISLIKIEKNKDRIPFKEERRSTTWPQNLLSRWKILLEHCYFAQKHSAVESFWGLFNNQIFGKKSISLCGYFAVQSPHYGSLGHITTHGCIFPPQKRIYFSLRNFLTMDEKHFLKGYFSDWGNHKAFISIMRKVKMAKHIHL